MPNFPVFTRSGEVTVSVELISSSMQFSADELARLYRFQRYLFLRVLRLEKEPMQFNPDNADSSYIVIALNEGMCRLNDSSCQIACGVGVVLIYIL